MCSSLTFPVGSGSNADLFARLVSVSSTHKPNMALADQNIEPITADTQPLTADEAEEPAGHIAAWSIGDDEIEREFIFKDFAEAMVFVNKVADNKVEIWLATHKVGGPPKNDFIVAARMDRLVR